MGDITSNPQSYGGFDYSQAQTFLDLGRGIGAQFISQPFDVYRVTDTSNGNIIDPSNLIYSNFPCVREKPKRMLLETGRGPIYWYQLQADLSLIKVGDVFVLNDPIYGEGSTSVNFTTNEFVGFSIATHPVLEENVGARLDRLLKVYRPPLLADSTGYMNQTFDAALPLNCVDGQFVLGDAGDPAALIPAGFMMDRKVRPAAIAGLEDQTPMTMWSIYIPSLPGFFFKETDWLITEDGARYRVVNPYEQQAGATGTQLLCQREVSQV